MIRLTASRVKQLAAIHDDDDCGEMAKELLACRDILAAMQWDKYSHGGHPNCPTCGNAEDSATPQHTMRCKLADLIGVPMTRRRPT